MTCKHCGANNGDNSVSCDICGYILDTSENDGQDAAKLAGQPQNSETPEADEENNPVGSEQHAAPSVFIYCMQCGSANTPDIRFCQFCGAPRQAVRRSEPAAAQPKKTRLALLCGIIAAAVVIIAAFLLLAGSSSALPIACYYKTGAIYASNLITLDTYQISDDSGSLEDSYVLSAYTFTSPDGRYLFYPEGDTIYRRDLTADPNNKNTTIKIDSDIGYFFEVTPDNKAVYIKQSNDGLYICDGDDREKVALDATSCTMNKDGTKLIYTNQNSDIFFLDIQTLSEEKIASDASLLCVSDDFSAVCYQKNGSLYEQIIGKDKEKIASELSLFIARMDDGTLYYTKSNTETIALADYLNDDMLEADAAISEPSIADFQTQEPYTNWWGDISYETVTDYDAYDAANSAYNDKLLRDGLRAQASEQTMDFTHETLYTYKDGEETALTDDFAYTLVTTDSGLLIYKKTTFAPPEKVNLSEVSDISSVTGLLGHYQSEDNAVYAVLNGTETLLVEEEPSTFAVDGTFFYSEDDKKLYFLDNYDPAESCGTLKSIVISDHVFSPPQIIDEDVSTCTFDPNANTLLYFKELQNGCGDLYMNGTHIDSDVSLNGMLLSKNADTLYYMTDISTDGLNATLMKWSKADKERVAYDVTQAVMTGDRLIYLADFSASNHSGDLYQYTGTEPKLIDDDVSYLFDTERYARKPVIYFMDFDYCFLDADEEQNNRQSQKVDILRR